MRTGLMYAGVPTRDFGGVCSWSCLQKPKSAILRTGVGDRPVALSSSLIQRVLELQISVRYAALVQVLHACMLSLHMSRSCIPYSN